MAAPTEDRFPQTINVHMNVINIASEGYEDHTYCRFSSELCHVNSINVTKCLAPNKKELGLQNIMINNINNNEL